MSSFIAVLKNLIPQNRLFLEVATTKLKGKHSKPVLSAPLMTFIPEKVQREVSD